MLIAEAYPTQSGPADYALGSTRPENLSPQNPPTPLFQRRRKEATTPVCQLKVGPFEPEYAGKMDFYLNLLKDLSESDRPREKLQARGPEPTWSSWLSC